MGAAREDGEIIVQFESADGSKSASPLRQRSERLGYVAPGSATDRRQMTPIAFRHGGAELDENGIVRVFFKADAADIIESEESSLLLDVTLINKATGSRTPTQLTFENMTGFTAAGTVDITLLAGAIAQVAYYTVPAGNILVLGHEIDGRAYAYIGDDT